MICQSSAFLILNRCKVAPESHWPEIRILVLVVSSLLLFKEVIVAHTRAVFKQPTQMIAASVSCHIWVAYFVDCRLVSKRKKQVVHLECEEVLKQANF